MSECWRFNEGHIHGEDITVIRCITYIMVHMLYNCTMVGKY